MLFSNVLNVPMTHEPEVRREMKRFELEQTSQRQSHVALEKQIVMRPFADINLSNVTIV